MEGWGGYFDRDEQPEAPKPSGEEEMTLVDALHAIVAECSNPECYICEEVGKAAERIKALEAALRPFAAASQLFTSGIHNGGIENVQNFPTAQEWRIAGGLFPEFGGPVRKSARELRAALSSEPKPEGCSCESYPHTCHGEPKQ